MSKDVKIEILYYKSSADVALEFGLHGDYPLRLLSVGNEDVSQLLHNLKKAIARSEIILIVGDWNADKKVVDLLARFIGRNTDTSDNSDYGITESGTVTLPAGAHPLVANGKYGGFVIESGPQTIFALNNDRGLMNAITEETLVPYITAHHRTFGFSVASAKTVRAESDNKAASAVVEAVFDATDDTQSVEEAEATIDAPTDIPTPTIVADGDFVEADELTVNPIECESVEADELTVDMTKFESANTDGLTVDTAKYEQSALSTPMVDAEESIVVAEDFCDLFDSLEFEEHEEKTAVPKSPKRNHREVRFIRVLCVILALLVLSGSVISAFFDIRKLYFDPDTYYAKLADMYNTPGLNASVAFDNVKKDNEAYFTWLTVTAANVDHPVISVNSAEAGMKYLTRLPNGWSHASGSLFSTTSTSPNLSLSSNTIIYGNAANGGIFENLKAAVSTPEIYNGYNITTADSRYRATWSVFSVFAKTDAESFDFTKATDGYHNYLDSLKSFSRFQSDIEFLGNETVLVLVGIDGNENFILAAKLEQVHVLSESTLVDSLTSDTASTDLGEPDIGNDKSEETNEPENDDFQGDSPDIEIELPPVNKPPVTSSKPSTSSVTSSTVSSKPSSTQSTTSSNTSTTVSTPSTSSSSVVSTGSSKPSSSASVSSVNQSTVSSSVSSATVTSSGVASSGTTSTPDVDPIFTWDKTFTITDNATGIKYTASAVDMVAMIIEDEMSPTIDPQEALIAQAIVKYNWLIHNNGGTNALDPNPTPQAKKYAEMAKGSLIMFGNTVAKTYCHSISAGRTANYHDIWGGGKYSYLVSVDCSVDATNSKFETVTVYSADTIRKVIKDVCGIDVSDMDKEKWLVPTEYDTDGVYCTKIKIGGKEYKGTYLRNSVLTKAHTGQSTIRSSAYKIKYNEEDDTFTVTVRGYGHGVGLSQNGAKQYAKQGWTHEQIIAHFFPGTTLVKY